MTRTRNLLALLFLAMAVDRTVWSEGAHAVDLIGMQ